MKRLVMKRERKRTVDDVVRDIDRVGERYSSLANDGELKGILKPLSEREQLILHIGVMAGLTSGSFVAVMGPYSSPDSHVYAITRTYTANLVAAGIMR